MPPILINALYVLLALLYLPLLLYQMLVLKKNRRGWAERFGHIPAIPAQSRSIWIHAVSLGEINATRTLVARLQQQFPNHRIVVSATTDTGYAAGCRLYPDLQVMRFPLDFSWIIRRVLRRIRPEIIVLMELEVWPNLIQIAKCQGIKVGIANGRVTHEKSMRRFQLPVVRSVAQKMFGQLDWVAAQNPLYAERFIRLGVPGDRINVVGSLKYDTASVADRVDGDTDLAAELGIDHQTPLIVAGSTGPGEEAMLLDAYQILIQKIPGLQLALIPRKPERFDEVARLIEKRKLICIRRSQPNPSSSTDLQNATPVFLGDTMGELRKFYSLADVIFIGRSLIPLGGSDPIEAAALGKPLCFGPYMENFSDAVEQLCSAGAAQQIKTAADLVDVLEVNFNNPQAMQAAGQKGQEIIKQNIGATDRTVAIIKFNVPLD